MELKCTWCSDWSILKNNNQPTNKKSLFIVTQLHITGNVINLNSLDILTLGFKDKT